MFLLPNLALSLGGNDFLLPYFERQFPHPSPENGEEAQIAPPVGAIRVRIDDGCNDADPEFDEFCRSKGLPVCELRCPSVVGTGMKGLPRRIAEGIYRGTYCLIRDNEARISVVHASDVAKAASFALGSQGTYTLTDMADPTICELSDALAFRLGDKRLFTLPPWAAKIWYGGGYYQKLTTDNTYPDTFTESFPDFHPHPVVDYLRTHVYDEGSL